MNSKINNDIWSKIQSKIADYIVIVKRKLSCNGKKNDHVARLSQVQPASRAFAKNWLAAGMKLSSARERLIRIFVCVLVCVFMIQYFFLLFF